MGLVVVIVSGGNVQTTRDELFQRKLIREGNNVIPAPPRRQQGLTLR